MSSNLKVNTILPSAGSNIGLGTDGGNLNVDGGCKVQVGTALTLGHTLGVQFATQNLHSAGFEVNQINASGIITASHFKGDGSQLTGISAGVSLANGADNRVVTATGVAALTGESGLLFTGTNLGIGNRTSSPDSLLHVHTSSGDSVIHVEAAADPKLRLRAHSGESIIQFADASSSNTGEINYVHSGDYLKFRVNASERLRIDSSGNVNFGAEKAVSLPSGTGIQVYNSSTPRIKLVNDTTGNAAGDGLQIYVSGSSAIFDQKEDAEMRFYTDATERLRIKDDGIVEIGTSIGASSDANIRLRLGRTGDCFLGIRATGSTSAQTGIKFGDSGSEHIGLFAYDHYNERFQINVAGNTRIYIDGAGDIFGQSSNSNIVGFMGAKTTSGTTDWNHSTNARSGNGFTLLLGSHSNGPGPGLYYHPFTFEYAQRDSNGNMTQLAIPYNGGAIYSRYRYSGSWSGWNSH